MVTYNLSKFKIGRQKVFKSNCMSGPEVLKKKSCSTQLSMKFILLINVEMPTIVGF